MQPRLHNWMMPLALLLICMSAFAQAQAADRHDRLIVVPDEAALVQDGHLLLAASFLASHLGYSVQTEGAKTSLKLFGCLWLFREGAAICSLDGVERSLPAPARRIGESLYLPARPLLEPLGARVQQLGGGLFAIEPPRTSLQDVRQGKHPDRVRLVLDLGRPVPFEWKARTGSVVLRVPSLPDPQGRDSLLRQLSFQEPLVPTVTQNLQNGWSEITVAHSSPHPPEVFTLAEPARIVVDLLRAEPLAPPPIQPPTRPSPETRPLPPQKLNGVEWRSCNFETARGPVQGWLLTVDPADPDITIRPALAHGTISARRTVHSIAQREGAYAAVNGGFFAPRGQPLGLLVVEGEWITGPLHQRAVLGFTSSGKPQIRNASLDAWVEFCSLGRLPIEGINCDHTGSDGVVIYTPRWGDVVVGSPRRTRLVVSGGTIQAILSSGEVAFIPRDGFVLSGAGLRVESLRRTEIGQQVRLLLDTAPAWPDLRHAVGGGPRLLQGGQIALQNYDERFRADVTNSIRPRTAVGVSGDGKLLLLVIDNVDRGMTLRELAGVMAKLGAVDAMNLDGGGSSAFWVAGQYLNQPGDGTPRAVSNAIIVIDRKPTAAGGP